MVVDAEWSGCNWGGYFDDETESLLKVGEDSGRVSPIIVGPRFRPGL